MVEIEKVTKRKKPTFLRRDWHKKIKFGKTVKKNRKWRGAKGRHNKIRLGQKGYSSRPKIGYSENKQIKGLIAGYNPIYVENLNQVKILKKGDGVIISHVGAKKRKEITDACIKQGLIILNKYKKQASPSEFEKPELRSKK